MSLAQENPELFLLLVKADSYLSLALYRYGERWPEDMKREANEVIAQIRRVT